MGLVVAWVRLREEPPCLRIHQQKPPKWRSTQKQDWKNAERSVQGLWTEA